MGKKLELHIRTHYFLILKNYNNKMNYCAKMGFAQAKTGLSMRLLYFLEDIFSTSVV